jgi:thiamine-monophosphate kinase
MSQKNEFDLIRHYFAPLADDKGALNLQDDAALYTPTPGNELVLTTDTIIEGVHYLPDTPPEKIAAKLFGVNVSDLAAKGGTPKACLINFAPRKNIGEAWIAAFAEQVGAALKAYDIKLLGGDTVAAPDQAMFSLTLIGEVASGAMVQRAGAKIGDDIFVTGTVGHGFIGLEDAKAERSSPFRDLFECPQPPLAFALVAASYMSAAVDVSDGLAADLGHICRASVCGMQINLPAIPFADPASKDLLAQLNGGDDYQLAFTAASENHEKLKQLAAEQNIQLSKIGHITEGSDFILLNSDGLALDYSSIGTSQELPSGFSHFGMKK